MSKAKRTGKRGNATGNLSKQTPKGNWIGRYYDHEGRRRKRSTGTTDKAAAERILREWIAAAALRREGVIDAKADGYAEADRRPVADHLADYRSDLLNRGRTRQPAHEVHALATRLTTIAQIDRLSGMTADRIAKAIRTLEDEGKSQRTQLKAHRSIKGWTRWLVDSHRLPADPLASLRGVSVTKRVHERRALTHNEAASLIHATECGAPWRKLSGRDRAALYRVALGTGFRRGVLASLTPADFDLDLDAPTITVRAAYSKRRRDDAQPIHADLARWLASWLAERPTHAPLWTLHRDTGRMLRADLDAARAAWEGEATTDAARDARRREPSFLRTPDAAGRVVDFHALRHSYVSGIVASGASVKICQELARHSTPTLTIGTYAHVRLADLRGALPTVPTSPTDTEAAAGTLAATGTDHQRPADAEPARTPCGQRRAQLGRETTRAGASKNNESPATDDSGEAPKSLRFADSCGSVRAETNGEGGIRTPDDPKAIPDFESGAFNRSATSPGLWTVLSERALTIGRNGPAVTQIQSLRH